MSAMDDFLVSSGVSYKEQKVEDMTTEELLRERFTFIDNQRADQIIAELTKRGEIKPE